MRNSIGFGSGERGGGKTSQPIVLNRKILFAPKITITPVAQ